MKGIFLSSNNQKIHMEVLSAIIKRKEYSQIELSLKISLFLYFQQVNYKSVH